MTRARLLGLPAAALAAGVPTLLAGLLGATTPLIALGPDDGTVRTVTVDPPAAGPTDAELGLDGAHPPSVPLEEVPDAAAHEESDGSRGVPVPVSGTALPARVLLSYRRAAAAIARTDPTCHLPWSLLAGIGQVESGHASGGAVDRGGVTPVPILGPVLDGVGAVAAIADTDGGAWDGDTTWDRAVGPMQFIPSSWAGWGRDGDGDGDADPSDVDDASLAAATYLCAGDRDLRDVKVERSAVLSYNHSWDYVDLVLAWAEAYATGVPVTTVRSASEVGGRDVEGRVQAVGDEGAGPVRLPAGTPVSTAPASTSAATTATVTQPEPSSAPTGTPSTPTTATPAESLSPTPTAIPTPTASSTPTPSDSTLPCVSPTPSPSATPTDSPSPMPTETPSPSLTASPTATSTADPTATGCPTASPPA